MPQPTTLPRDPDFCFWWEKFTQQEAFTIPEHGRITFADGSILIFFSVGECGCFQVMEFLLDSGVN
jgi:hypothetical protein